MEVRLSSPFSKLLLPTQFGENDNRGNPHYGPSLSPFLLPRYNWFFQGTCTLPRHVGIILLSIVCVGGGGWCLCVCVFSCFSHVQHFVTPWTVTLQVPLSKEYSRQEYWSGWPFPPPGDLPDPGIKPRSLASPVSAGRFFTTVSPRKFYLCAHQQYIVLLHAM